MPKPSTQSPVRTPRIHWRTLCFLLAVPVLLFAAIWAAVAGITTQSGFQAPPLGQSQGVTQDTSGGITSPAGSPGTPSASQNATARAESISGILQPATAVQSNLIIVTPTGVAQGPATAATYATSAPLSIAIATLSLGGDARVPAIGLFPTSSVQPNPEPSPAARLQTVFIIMMENHNWSEIKGSPSAPYINKVLLPQGSYTEQYYNPPGNHPSEPNYLWLEGGTNFGISDDANPSANHQSTTEHLVTLLNNKRISWKAYQEGISGSACPLTSSGLYAPKHNPMVYFDDVTGGNSHSSAYCIAHERPFTELATDLQNNTAPRYSFITPNLCNDMHNSSGCPSSDSIRNGDNWLAGVVPDITSSEAYKEGGVLFITWDEGEQGSDGPIGMIVLSPLAKGDGYAGKVRYTHSSTLRTVQEIFGVTPLLGDAANANDLSDLFKSFP